MLLRRGGQRGTPSFLFTTARSSAISTTTPSVSTRLWASKSRPFEFITKLNASRATSKNGRLSFATTRMGISSGVTNSARPSSLLYSLQKRSKSGLSKRLKSFTQSEPETPNSSRSFWYFVIRPGLFAFGVGAAALFGSVSFKKRFHGWLDERGFSRRDQAQIAVYSFIGVNAIVFGLWHLPRCIPFMLENFLHVTESGKVRTILTSAFSHMGMFHFAANMYVLHSWGMPLAYVFGPELFWGFCVSAAAASGYFAHVFHYYFERVARPSLGASGIVCAVLAATVYLRPESHLGIILLPWSFEVRKALPTITLIEVCAMLYVASGRTSPLGHAAHFSGLVFGWWLLNYLVGSGSFLDSLREKRIYPFG